MHIDSDGLKFCPECQERKAREEFAKNKNTSDGLTVYCKVCRNARERARHEADTEGKERRARRYRQQCEDPKFIKAQADRSAAWYARASEDEAFMARRRQRDRDTYASKPDYGRAKAQRQWAEMTATEEGRAAANARHANYVRQRYAEDEDFRQYVRDYFRTRNATKRSNGGSLSITDWQKLCALSAGRCLKCGREGVELDHVIPVALGGSSNVINVQPLCRSCNASKRDQIEDYRTPVMMQWLAERVS